MRAMKPDSPQPRKNSPALSSLTLVTSSRCFQSKSRGLSWTGSQTWAEKMNSAENPAERLLSGGQDDPAHRALLCPYSGQGRFRPLGREGECFPSEVLALKFFFRWFYMQKSSRRNSPWGCRVSERQLTVWLFSPWTNIAEKNDCFKIIISSGIEKEQAREYFILPQWNIYNSEVAVFFLAFSDKCKTVQWLALHEVSVKDQQYF